MGGAMQMQYFIVIESIYRFYSDESLMEAWNKVTSLFPEGKFFLERGSIKLCSTEWIGRVVDWYMLSELNIPMEFIRKIILPTKKLAEDLVGILQAEKECRQFGFTVEDETITVLIPEGKIGCISLDIIVRESILKKFPHHL